MAQPPPGSSPQMVAAFFEESLQELADLAARMDLRNLSATLALAAMEAARAAVDPRESPN